MSTENKDTEKSTSATTTPIQAGSLTQLLSQYRTDARLGHEQVSEALCLPVSSVKALENEQFDKLPEPPYIRGYLRTYARLANQDSAEAIKIYDTLHGGSSSSTTNYNYTLNNNSGGAKKSSIAEIAIRFIVLALFLSILGLLTMHPTINQWLKNTWSSFSSEQVSNNDNKLPGDNLIDPKVSTGDIPGNLPISDEPKKTSPETTTTNNNQTSNTETATTETDTTNPENTDPSPATTQETTTAETNDTETAGAETTENNTDPVTPDAGKVKLKLVFSDEVWLRIQNNDKKTVFEALNSADTEKELILTPPLKFKVGSAHGLKIYVNGKEKDITEYTKGSIARFNIEKEQPNEQNGNEPEAGGDSGNASEGENANTNENTE